VALGLVVAVTLLAFEPVRHNDLVNWDDTYLLVDNDAYRGLSGEHLRWMFTTSLGGHYQPLTWLSYALDWHVWDGLNPVGFHLTNLLLHVLVAVGFFFVTLRLLAAALAETGTSLRRWAALLGTLFFAVHPLRVESVVWATERRDVLSGVWLLATVLLYLRAVGARSRGAYLGALAAALVCHVLSLLSKAWGITLPAVLLVLDVYPLRRLGGSPPGWWAAPVRKVWYEKVAFLLPALGSAVLAGWAQAQSGALWTLTDFPLSLRVGQAFYGLVFYARKTLWPAGLLPLYEQDPNATPWDLPNLLAAGVVVIAALLLLRWRRKRPALVAGAVVYVLLLLPVLGFTQSGQQRVADRYSYLACLPWAVLLAGAVGTMRGPARTREADPQRYSHAVPVVAGVVLVAVLVGLTRAQTGIWRDSYTLWTHVLSHDPWTPTAHANLADVLIERGDYAGARRHVEKVLEVLPGDRAAHLALARAAAALGDLRTAREHFLITREIDEHLGRESVLVLLGLAEVESRLGHHAEAARLCELVVEREPRFQEGFYWLGVTRQELRNYDGAKKAWERVLELTPGHVRAQARLAWLLATCPVDELRDGPRAVQLARSAVDSSQGEGVMAREALAAALAETGDYPQATAVAAQLLEDTQLPHEPDRAGRVRAALYEYQSGRPFRATPE